MVTDSDRAVVQQVQEAMQQGPSGTEAMLALFTEDAVLIEPFNGQPKTHEGKAAIRTRYAEMMQMPRPPDFKVEYTRLDSDAGVVVADWICTSSVLPAPMRGIDRYTIRDGKIQRLEIRLAAPQA